MGLSGRKSKQRIGKDPRNLSWADDASRFGQAYLEKFGWDASKGLGASGEGRTSAIKTTQKLDMLGIGMRHQSDLEGGIAWRQNRDFEDLLRRLNDGTTTTTETTNTTELLDSFHKAREHKSQALEDGDGVEKVNDDDSNGDSEEAREGVMAKKEKKKKKKKKKRKAAAEEEEAEERGPDRKERKKRRKKSLSKDRDDDGRRTESERPPPRPSREAPRATESGAVPMGTGTATTRATAVAAPVPVRAPPRTHRARIIAAKRMAASNSTALAEILGIPSSSPSSAYPSAVASPLPGLPDPALAFVSTTTTTTIATTSTATTSNATATPEAKDLLQTLTTSSQSVGDYFKAKLNAKARGERQARPTSAAASASTRDDDGDGRASLGLGLGRGSSRISSPDDLDEEPVRGGIGASSSSMFATMFMPRQPTTNAREENNATAGVEIVVSHGASGCDDNLEKSENIRAKEDRRRKREERRRKRAEAEKVDRVAVDAPVDGESSAARSKKKHRELEASDGQSEPSSADGREVIATKKRKKDKKSSEHRRLEE